MGKAVPLLATLVASLGLACGAALAVTPAGAPGSTGQATVGDTQGRDAALDASLKALVARRGGPPGVIVVVQRGSHREVHAFGVRNLESGLPMRAGDSMRLASTSKAFSGAVALSLVGKGRLSPNDTIGEYLSGLPVAWHEITLRQLLRHTSGLPNYTETTDFAKAIAATPEKAPPPRKLLSYVKDEPLNFEPGTQYRYSNTDNVTVGLMVEAVTGDTYEHQLHKRVFRPLGLQNTSLPPNANLNTPFIHGYDNDPSQNPPEDLSEVLDAGWLWAAGAMLSTPSDLNDFARGYVGGQLFDTRTRAVQRKIVEGGSSDPPGPGDNPAGLGIFRYQTSCGTMWGHTGNYPGYTQFLAASPDGKRSVTVSVNEQLSPVQGAPGVFDALRRAESEAVCAALAGG